jgi:two-component system, NtrC family, response regulator GlrR
MAEATQSADVPHLIGRSSGLMRVVQLIERMARYQAPVLIVGETGTGKELAARSIHYRSCRRDAPFVAVNCGAMPETLIETELFGCERGAFTDARQARSGLVSAAEGGTLFLDEVDALPARAQVSLLRFLQDSMYRPIGGVREKHADVRVIAAASPRLHRLLQAGDFRDDLVFRLTVLLLEMPPLRERHGDPEVLATYFISRYARQYNVAQKVLDTRSRAWLQSYTWPGNVRELDNLVQRALLLSDGDGLGLPPEQISVPQATGANDTRGESPAASLGTYNEARQQALSRFEREYLDRLMTAAGGNVTHAARLAGKERRAMGKLLKKNGFTHPGLDSPSSCDGAD